MLRHLNKHFRRLFNLLFESFNSWGNYYLHNESSSLNVLRMYAHSLLTTARSSACVRAARICRIRSRSRIGVGILTRIMIIQVGGVR